MRRMRWMMGVAVMLTAAASVSASTVLFSDTCDQDITLKWTDDYDASAGDGRGTSCYSWSSGLYSTGNHWAHEIYTIDTFDAAELANGFTMTFDSFQFRQGEQWMQITAPGGLSIMLKEYANDGWLTYGSTWYRPTNVGMGHAGAPGSFRLDYTKVSDTEYRVVWTEVGGSYKDSMGGWHADANNLVLSDVTFTTPADFSSAANQRIHINMWSDQAYLGEAFTIDNIVLTAVPEPMTMLTLALGGVSMVLKRRVA